MSDKEALILEAAIELFTRYGIRRTTIGDIAKLAGTSRQTLYASFANKEEVIVAAITHYSTQSLLALERVWVSDAPLAQKLDDHFRIAIVEPFEAMASSPDMKDILLGPSKDAQAAVQCGNDARLELLAHAFQGYAPQLERNGQTVEDFANFAQTASIGFKYNAASRSDLDTLLQSLKTIILRTLQ
ncbi:TetR/AcrR family transcriptional regulator [Litoreibacter janthinus]|uniref:Transcriptional regulator, TetR family n=1 Tax=Litoreibacter janthinus TaxID=670154 RepID=A0A1I6GDN2_9RHOB|nr:TetR/AcrR family transcriptional regulator [Litoreibacter janthinus]SFR40299.1 transcriptional regulator, TetR family [Litoreibacter janthinus]